MALESTGSWIARETHKSNEQQQIFIAEPVQSVHPQQRSGPKLASKQNTQTERFTQTEYRANCVELVATTTHKDAVMFEQTIQQNPQPVSVQMYSTIEKKDIAPDKGSNIAEFPFCYNVLQKVHQSQASNPTTTAVASITTADDKACYRFDVAQPFGYNYALVNQMSLAAAASSATFKCDECGLVFAHLSLLNHHKRIHSNVNMPTDRIFQNEQTGAVKVQVKTTTTKPRNCDTCGDEVYDCEHSNGAKKKVTKYVKCENCQTGSSTATTTNETFPSSPPEPPSPPEIINIPNKGLHLVKRHGGLATVTKCHKCNGSGIIFVGGTRPSPTTTEKPFRCNVCDGSFSRYSSLWSHKRLHTGDKPFKCDMCGLTFARAAYLKNHIRVHSGEKPYKCNVCGMQFSQSPHLKNHERIHSGERPYQCEVCEKTFARHSTLWNHRRIHTGEKPYRCSVCGSAFNQATHLKNHAKVHTGEKPHRCDICEVGFSDRFALKRHRLIHEKYGRTSNNCQAQSQQPQHPTNSQSQQSEAHMGEMYKCEVAFPGQQPQSANPSQQPQPPTPVEIYKCEVGTTVSFPQHQAAQTNQSSNPPAPQAAQITEVYKVDVASNTIQYQNQSTQQQNTSSLGQQQTGQINEIYKFDVRSTVGFPGPAQQSQETSTQPNPPQQMAQYEVGSTAVSFVGQSQQPPPSSNSQQITQLGNNTYPERASETILGT